AAPLWGVVVFSVGSGGTLAYPLVGLRHSRIAAFCRDRAPFVQFLPVANALSAMRDGVVLSQVGCHGWCTSGVLVTGPGLGCRSVPRLFLFGAEALPPLRPGT